MRVDNLQAQFDTTLAPHLKNNTDTIGLAVSGGGDSIALLRMAGRSSLISNDRVYVFTVDHGLRPESADEALFVCEQCEVLGISHRTLLWSQPNPSQARARSARHKLLANAVREQGGTLLVTGHTLSDNVESFLMRARASSGWYGLSGMGAVSASPVWPDGQGVFIARPMLGMHRKAIREWLQDQGIGWRDDPTNENMAYERVRMRRLLSDAPQMSARISSVQRKLSLLRKSRDTQIANWLSTAEARNDELHLQMPGDMSAEALAQSLSLACMAVASTDTPTRANRSLAAAQKLKTASSLTFTLGGTVVRCRLGTIEISREKNRPDLSNTANFMHRLQHICAGLTGRSSA